MAHADHSERNQGQGDPSDGDDPAIEPIRSLLIVGAGWTGRQIAAQAAAHGVTVFLQDRDVAITADALRWVGEHLKARRADGTWPYIQVEQCHARVGVLTKEELSKAPPIDLVLECVVEQIAIKRRVLKELSAFFHAPTIIASNSSYFVPSMLAHYVLEPDRFLHLHFHVPIWISTLVDIVPCSQTSDAHLLRVEQFAKSIGQFPLVERKENPGYVFNWLLQAWLKAALQLVQREVATPDQVDFVWRQLSGMKVGPFATMDHIGIDVIHQVLSNARW